VLGKTIKRETAVLDRRRPIIIELFPHSVGVRVKGTREFHTVDWGAVLDLARKLDARTLATRKGAA